MGSNELMDRPPIAEIHIDDPGGVMNDVAASEADATVENKPDGPRRPAPCADQPLPLRIEVLLLAADRPINESRIADVLSLQDEKPASAIRAAIDSLNETYKSCERSFRIERLAGGWQILTLPTFGPIVSQLHRDRQETRLSPAAMETLAIIAYRQPILRADIEAIRGVAAGEVLRTLLDRRLVKVVGRAEELGRPMLYGTTREFLKVFGLSALADLPPIEGRSESSSQSAAVAPSEELRDNAPEPGG